MSFSLYLLSKSVLSGLARFGFRSFLKGFGWLEKGLVSLSRILNVEVVIERLSWLKGVSLRFGGSC